MLNCPICNFSMQATYLCTSMDLVVAILSQAPLSSTEPSTELCETMEFNGTVKTFNPHKGWGFVDCNGQDMFLHKKDLKGFCPSKGNQVQFTVGQTEKGAVAENVKVLSALGGTSYYGKIKNYNPFRGFGFISSEAFPDQDVFVLWSELPGGFGPQGSPCKFNVSMDENGPAAKRVVLLGAGSQIQQMKWMMGYGDYNGFNEDKTCWDLQRHGTCARAAEGKRRWEPCKAGEHRFWQQYIAMYLGQRIFFCCAPSILSSFCRRRRVVRSKPSYTSRSVPKADS